MNDCRFVTICVPDDGISDGFYWHNGERYLRENGKEYRLLDIAPNLERDVMENEYGQTYWQRQIVLGD